MAAQSMRKERSTLWVIKQFTGVLVFVLILVHLVVNHFVAPNGLLNYQEVVRYLANPAIAIMEITFLIVVTFHSLLGLRSVLMDLNPSEKITFLMDRIMIVVGIAAICYGIILTVTIANRL
jgi:succinate dehydrogenase cytochrome b556 subunit